MADVLAVLGAPVVVDYVRLNIDAIAYRLSDAPAELGGPRRTRHRRPPRR